MYDIIVESANISIKEDMSTILNDMVAYIYRNYILLDEIQDNRIKFIKTNQMYSLTDKVSVYNIEKWLKSHDYTRIIYLKNGGAKEVAGIISGWVSEYAVILNSIYIRESLRRIGIGFTALKTVIRELQLSSIKEIHIIYPSEYGLIGLGEDAVGLFKMAGFSVQTDSITTIHPSIEPIGESTPLAEITSPIITYKL